MSRFVSAKRFDPSSADWSDKLRVMRRRLEGRPSLLPHHFLEAVLPKIGGACFALNCGRGDEAGSLVGYAFLLPRDISGEGATYTLRYEHVAGSTPLSADEISGAVERCLPPNSSAYFYLPDAAHSFKPTHIEVDGVDCGRPGEEEAAEIRSMQQSIWHSPPDGLYPSDLHSVEGGAGCSLVARIDGAVAGFLLGFFRFSACTAMPAFVPFRQELQLESQLLAVAPGLRRRRIGQALKRLQARQALESGIDLISWTTDPLLFANGLLNFTRLGAVACEFKPSLYSFRNELNRVTAARLNLLWAVRTKRVQKALLGSGHFGPIEIESDPDLTVVNQGHGAPLLSATSARIAIEIPSDWVALQRQDQPAAQRWRDVTNQLLDHYLGSEPGQYFFTATGILRSRRYIIGERVDDSLLDDLFTLA